MATHITITMGKVRLHAELNDSLTALKLKSLLPLEVSMSRWGDEYYGNCGIGVQSSADAREVMEIGELAIWPAGKALCIFFGPTPASKEDEPRAISPVNPVGRIIDGTEPLKELGGSILAKLELSG